jgi:hypothetical protein
MFMGGGGRRGAMGGLSAEPGIYSITLKVGDQTAVGKVVVRLDPLQTNQ